MHHPRHTNSHNLRCVIQAFPNLSITAYSRVHCGLDVCCVSQTPVERRARLRRHDTRPHQRAVYVCHEHLALYVDRTARRQAPGAGKALTHSSALPMITFSCHDAMSDLLVLRPASAAHGKCQFGEGEHGVFAGGMVPKNPDIISATKRLGRVTVHV